MQNPKLRCGMKKSICALVLLTISVAASSSAHASSITYTFTGAEDFAGTNFTYISPSGFLSFSNFDVAPTTATDYFFDGTDFGQLTGFDFINSVAIGFSSASAGLSIAFSPAYQISALTPSENVISEGTLSITLTPASGLPTAAAPEPSSFALLGTGIAGLAGIIRRRRACPIHRSLIAMSGS
jgi:hypothetical protein